MPAAVTTNKPLYSRLVAYRRGIHDGRSETGPAARILERYSTDRLRRTGAGGGTARLRLGVDRRGLRFRRVDSACVDRRQHEPHTARYRRMSVVCAHTDGHRDGGDDARSSFRRAHDPRARRLRSAGSGRLVRRAVQPTVGAHARIHRHHSAGVAPRRTGRELRVPTIRCRTRAKAPGASASR